MSAFEDVAGAADVAEGAMLDVTLTDGTPVCLFRLHGVIGAVGNICTHSEFLMSDGFLNPDGTIECGWHGARFDCRTGAVKRQPAPAPLPVYLVRVDGERVLIGDRVQPVQERAS